MRDDGSLAGPTTLIARDDGAGEPVVLLHGFPGSSADWDEVATRLAVAYRVLVPDLLGFGRSPRPTRFEELWVDAQADALTRMLDEHDVERAALVGHDYGGPIALTLAHRQPERVSALALAATNVFVDTPVPFPLAAVCWPLVGDAAARALFSAPSLALLGRRATRGRRPSRNDAREARTIETIFTHALRDISRLYAPIEPMLRQITIPRIVVWGDSDPIFPLEQGHRTAAALGAELTVLAHTGHFVAAERPAELTAAIAKLLET